MHSATDSTFGAQLTRQASFVLNIVNVADIATVIVLPVEAFLCEHGGLEIESVTGLPHTWTLKHGE